MFTRYATDGVSIGELARWLTDRAVLTATGDPSSLPGVAEAVALSGNCPSDEGWVRWRVTLVPGADPQSVLEACFARGLVLRGFEREEPSLHDVFMHLVGRDRRSDTKREAA